MDSISAIAVTGMQAAHTRMAVAAHNIANLSTDGFQRQAVIASALPGGGVATTVEPTAARPGAGEFALADIIELKLASYQFRANALVLQRTDDTLGALLDVRA
jgi:hypothetical protein